MPEMPETPELKPLSPSAVAGALEKALRYRLLNEPMEAESICRDVLDVQPDHHEALVTLILSLTDQFDRYRSGLIDEARTLVARLGDAYSREYYAGILWERHAKARYRRGGPGAGFAAHAELGQAMEHFDKAVAIRPAGNDEAVLRWNACVRFLDRFPDITPAPEEAPEPLLE